MVLEKMLVAVMEWYKTNIQHETTDAANKKDLKDYKELLLKAFDPSTYISFLKSTLQSMLKLMQSFASGKDPEEVVKEAMKTPHWIEKLPEAAKTKAREAEKALEAEMQDWKKQMAPDFTAIEQATILLANCDKAVTSYQPSGQNDSARMAELEEARNKAGEQAEAAWTALLQTENDKGTTNGPTEEQKASNELTVEQKASEKLGNTIFGCFQDLRNLGNGNTESKPTAKAQKAA